MKNSMVNVKIETSEETMKKIKAIASSNNMNMYEVIGLIFDSLFSGIKPLPLITKSNPLTDASSFEIRAVLPLSICQQVSALAQINDVSNSHALSFILWYGVKNFDLNKGVSKEQCDRMIFNMLSRMATCFYDTIGSRQEFENMVYSNLAIAIEEHEADKFLDEMKREL